MKKTRFGWLTIGIIILSILMYFSPLALAIPAERDDFVTLGRAGEDSEGRSILLEEKITLRVAPNINSPEQGRLDSGASVRVLDIKEMGAETFYFVMKIGEGGGLSGWVREEYIYEILAGQPEE